jgi:hypothetical protein
MTRDDLEATIWRALGRQASAAVVDVILAAADRYAIAETLTARDRGNLQMAVAKRQQAAERTRVPMP